MSFVEAQKSQYESKGFFIFTRKGKNQCGEKLNHGGQAEQVGCILIYETITPQEG